MNIYVTRCIAKKKILTQLSMSQEELKEYPVNDLSNLFGIKNPQAKALWAYLHEDDNDKTN